MMPSRCKNTSTVPSLYPIAEKLAIQNTQPSILQVGLSSLVAGCACTLASPPINDFPDPPTS